MLARKLVCYGLVFAPSLMLGFIGLGARAYQETYEFDHFTPAQDALTSPYIELLRTVADLPAVVNREADAEKIRKIGNLWASAVMEGRAKTIPVLDLDQSTSWVVCEEVTSAKARLSWSLWRAAQYEIERRNYDQAARDLQAAFIVNQATKGMNLFTIAQSSRRQEMILGRLIDINPYLSPRVRLDVKRRVAKAQQLNADSEEKMRMVRASLKVASADTEAHPFGDREVYNYWTKVYYSSQRCVASLERRWAAYCSSASSPVRLAGPMPKELVFKHENRKPASSRPYFADRLAPYRFAMAVPGH